MPLRHLSDAPGVGENVAHVVDGHTLLRLVRVEEREPLLSRVDPARRDARGDADARARLGPIYLLVANAGVAYGTDAPAPDADTLEAEFRVNLFGAFFAIEAVIPSMREHRTGHIVVMSSLAGHRGLPGAAGYCATKAALTRLVEGMRPDWALAGIRSTIVHPGYVRSEMTDRNRFRMPFLLETDRAARLIARAIRRKKKLYEFRWRMSILVRWLVRHLPDRLLVSRVRADKQRARL